MRKNWEIFKKRFFKKGFTLLETVVAIGIFLLIVVAAFDFVQTIISSQEIMSLESTAQKEARKTLEEFVKETRNASASSIGSYLIAEATAVSLTFYSDIDSDTYREKVRYFVDGTNLKKGVIKPAGTPLSYNPDSETVSVVVKNLIAGSQPFSYFDKNYDGSSVSLAFPVIVMDIKLIKVILAIDQKVSRSPEPLQAQTQVEIRNLKYAE